jgi:hypothetical protein
MARVVTGALLVLAVAVDLVEIIRQELALLAVVREALHKVVHDQAAQLWQTLDQVAVVLVTTTLAAQAVQVFASLSIGVKNGTLCKNR